MYLCITFQNELVPFILEQATDKECMQAIEKAKDMGFHFNRANYVVENDRIILHAINGTQKSKHILYCLNGEVILQTDARYPDEIIPTKELLAYEMDVDVDQIYTVTF